MVVKDRTQTSDIIKLFPISFFFINSDADVSLWQRNLDSDKAKGNIQVAEIRDPRLLYVTERDRKKETFTSAIH